MPKLKRHECKSIKEYNKICRKYCKYFKNRHLYQTLWYVWIWIDILDPWDKNLIKYGQSQLKKGYRNLSLIIKDVQNNYEWKFSDDRYVDFKFSLKGIEITNEDFYYIYTNQSGDKQYSSCVGGFKDILHGKHRKEI